VNAEAAAGELLQQQPTAVGELLAVGRKAGRGDMPVDHEGTDLWRRFLCVSSSNDEEEREKQRREKRQRSQTCSLYQRSSVMRCAHVAMV
jgi:hypothetical protein